MVRRKKTATRNPRVGIRIIGDVGQSVIVGKPVEAAEVRVAVEDPDPADKVAKIELFEDGTVVESHEPADGGGQWTVNHKAAPGSHHYFVKVTQTDGNLLWSAPVWVTVVFWKRPLPSRGRDCGRSVTGSRPPGGRARPQSP
jgi:hypothetical protein